MLGKFSVKKPYTVLVAVVLIIVLGVVSFTKMTTDLLPNISLPYVIVMTTYPGASPETVETVVTKPVESSMATVSNIEGISSVSSENYSMVILEFAQSTDMNAVSLEIRENLDQIKSYWNDSIGSPIIMKLNPDMLPVMIAAVGGRDMSEAQVSELTRNTVIPELESIEGVASASATGLLEESVNVIIRQEKIDEINKQVFGSIDDEMSEAEKELADGKQEIYDGQSELADAQAEIEDSKAELEENKQKLEDSKQEIADGKKEIADNKTQLEEGKTELANKKGEAAKKLAEAETQIVTAKADLEATKMHITANLTTLKASVEGYNKAKDGLAQIETQASAQGFSSLADLESKIAELEETISKLEALGSTLEGVLDKSGTTLEDAIGSENDEKVEELFENDLGINTIEGESSTEDVLMSLEEAQAALAQMKALQQTWSMAAGMVENLEASINANTMGLGADAYIAQMEGTLKEI